MSEQYDFTRLKCPCGELWGEKLGFEQVYDGLVRIHCQNCGRSGMFSDEEDVLYNSWVFDYSAHTATHPATNEAPSGGIPGDRVLSIVDACFHAFASSHRIDAKEMAKEILARRDIGKPTTPWTTEPPSEEAWTAWLVEDGGSEPRYRTMEQGLPIWTTDPLKALHFCRREDAALFAEEDEDAWRITEHLFQGPLKPSGEV